VGVLGRLLQEWTKKTHCTVWAQTVLVGDARCLYTFSIDALFFDGFTASYLNACKCGLGKGLGKLGGIQVVHSENGAGVRQTFLEQHKFGTDMSEKFAVQIVDCVTGVGSQDLCHVPTTKWFGGVHHRPITALIDSPLITLAESC
jgi:hypothetical protein